MVSGNNPANPNTLPNATIKNPANAIATAVKTLIAVISLCFLPRKALTSLPGRLRDTECYFTNLGTWFFALSSK